VKNQKLYMQIYDYYKVLIEDGKLPEGNKLPSIRRCAEERNVSRTTVELAYMCLCDDGYVLPKNQSGYYVSKRGANLKSVEKNDDHQEEKSHIIYDFSSSGVDGESFDMNIWKRYLKSALRQTEKLLFYGESQGEKELRIEIAKYVREARNCVCTEENIVIGAGVQALLNILCPLLKGKRTVSFEDMSYKQGITVFKDYGFKVLNEKEKSNILYVSPSYSSRWGDTMDIGERFALTEYARENSKLIIEDDYGSEFRYFNRPTPSLQGLDGGENVVYLGTFSKLLLPSIRISFMILPSALLKEYKKKSALYNQTVSKADQIALCSYIRDGHLNSQIRKTRKLYIQKSKALSELLVQKFEDKVSILKNHSPLYVKCELECAFSLDEVVKRLEEKGVSVIPIKSTKKGVEIAFSVSSVSVNNLEKSVNLLYSVF
jgi:GntR family transcriptional regulator/MocR family aminotransferase